MIETLAGNEGKQFFGMTSELGPGFFILIAYSVFAGLFQYLFYCAVSQYYQIDVHDNVNYVWTTMFACFLKDADVGKAANGEALEDQERTESTSLQEI